MTAAPILHTSTLPPLLPSRESALLTQLHRIHGRMAAALKLVDQLGDGSVPASASPLVLPRDPSAFPATLPAFLTSAEAVGEVAPVMAPANVAVGVSEPPPSEDGTLPVFPGRFRSLIPDESDAEDEEEEGRIALRERREREAEEGRRRVEAGETTALETRAAAREVRGGGEGRGGQDTSATVAVYRIQPECVLSTL